MSRPDLQESQRPRSLRADKPGDAASTTDRARQAGIVAGLLVVLLVATVLSVRWMFDARAAALAAAEEAAATAYWVDRIQNAGGLPGADTRGAGADGAGEELDGVGPRQRLVGLARELGLPVGAIEAIDVGRSRGSATGTPPLRVVLRGVSPGETARFVDGLSEALPGVQVRALRMAPDAAGARAGGFGGPGSGYRADAGGDEPSRWRVDLEIS